MNKKGYNNSTFSICLLVLFVIICQILRYKTIYIESNHILETSISNIIYPFTFLFIILFNEKTCFKDSHKIIINTSITFIIFMILITFINNITSSIGSINIDIILKQIFTPNNILIHGFIYYYPDILNIIVFTLLFYFSHIIILILYEAIKPFTNKFITFFLSMFIPYTLDTLCYTTIIDIFNKIEFNNLIIHLTSNFVIVIVATILITIIYSVKKES